jgi:O-antigen/teichoic acid export membrane protein
LNIVKRILINAASIWLAKIVSIATAVFLVPILLAALGQYEYGLWVSIGQGIGILALLDLGVANSVSRFVSRADALNDVADKNGIYSVSMLVFWCAAILVATIVFAIAHFVPIWLNVDPTKYQVARIMFLILGCRVALTFPLRVGRGLLQSVHRYDFIEIIIIIASLTKFTLIVVLNKFALFNLYVLCVVAVSCDIAMEWLLFNKARRLHSSVKFSWQSINADRFIRVFSLSSSSLVQTIAGMFDRRGQVLAVSIILGIDRAPLYAISNNLLRRIGGMVGRIGTTFIPIASSADARDEKDKVVKLSIYGFRYPLLLGLVLGGYLMLNGRDLVALWLSHSGVSPEDVNLIFLSMMIMVFPLVISRSGMGNRSILRATGNHWLVSNSLVVVSVMALLLSIVLMKWTKMGVLGAAVGWSTRALVLEGVVFAAFVVKKYDISPGRYLRQVFVNPLLTALVIYSVNAAIAEYWLQHDVKLRLGFGTLVYGVVAGLFIFFIGLEREHRGKIQGYLWGTIRGFISERKFQNITR